jgi:fructose-specific phosphotransferase system component IIB
MVESRGLVGAKKELTQSDLRDSEAPIRAAVRALLARFAPES